jgi:hypothetical protein
MSCFKEVMLDNENAKCSYKCINFIWSSAVSFIIALKTNIEIYVVKVHQTSHVFDDCDAGVSISSCLNQLSRTFR